MALQVEGVKKISIGIEPKNYWEKIQGIIGIPSRPLTLLRKKDPKTKLDSAGKVSGLVQEYFNISIFQYFNISKFLQEMSLAKVGALS